MTPTKRPLYTLLLTLFLLIGLAGCGEREKTAAEQAVEDYPTPDGRVLTANQAADNLSVIDVATNKAYTTIVTGKQPHHVLGTPDGKEIWVTLYGENRLQLFDAKTLKEIASVDVGASNDDLTFDPSGKRLYVSLGNTDEVAVVDVPGRKLLNKVKVGKTPHGVKVTPDGKYLLVTNTADNTISLITLQKEPAEVEIAIKAGVNPFEVIVTDDNATAYVSNFLGDSISVVDLNERKTVASIRTGKKPAMLALQNGTNGQAQQIWAANTGSAELWLIDGATRKLVTRVPVGKGTHGVVTTPSGKLFVTNAEDNTVSVVDAAKQEVLTTIPVGNTPNGLTYLPNAQGQ
jgi:YVTN family beta-propeller protein